MTSWPPLHTGPGPDLLIDRGRGRQAQIMKIDTLPHPPLRKGRIEECLLS